MSENQERNDMSADEPPPFPPKDKQESESASAAAGAGRSGDEPPPFPSANEPCAVQPGRVCSQFTRYTETQIRTMAEKQLKQQIKEASPGGCLPAILFLGVISVIDAVLLALVPAFGDGNGARKRPQSRACRRPHLFLPWFPSKALLSGTFPSLSTCTVPLFR